MVDAHALGACGLGRAGSNPASPTNFQVRKLTANSVATVMGSHAMVGRTSQKSTAMVKMPDVKLKGANPIFI